MANESECVECECGRQVRPEATEGLPEGFKGAMERGKQQ